MTLTALYRLLRALAREDRRLGFTQTAALLEQQATQVAQRMIH